MEILRNLALTGGDWVIYLLLAGSVLAVGVIIERYLVLSRETQGLDLLRREMAGRLAGDELGSVAKETAKLPGIAAQILSAGVAKASQGVAAVEEHLAAASIEGRRLAEDRLIILGTLGNNAPFIGLFGTVLGVIKSFHDLAQSSAEGPEVVMQGLSQALVATAVGLFVAIPCVIAFNFYQKQAKDLMSGVESMSRVLLARLKADKK